MFANNNDSNKIHVRPILYYDDINPHSRAVLMLLNMLDVDVELRAVEMIKGEHLKSDYAKINPARTVPLLVHKDIVITDNAIFPYVCENNDSEKAKQLLALKCYKRHCRVLSRLFFESQVLHRIHGQLMTDLVRKTIYETDVEYHRKKVEYAYDVLETYLKDSPFIAGSVLTAADISFVACLGALDMMFPIAADAHRWEKLIDWFRRMRSLTVQKINANGIEKQRRIVEYFGKLSFKSDIKRFTTGIRPSLIPRMTLQHRRCTIAIQTTPQDDKPPFLNVSQINSTTEVNAANEVDLETQQNTIETIQRDSREENDVNEVESETKPNTIESIRQDPHEESNPVDKVKPEEKPNTIEIIQDDHKQSVETMVSTSTDAASAIIERIMPFDEQSSRISKDVPEYPAPPTEEEINELIRSRKDTFLKTNQIEIMEPAEYASNELPERSTGGAQKEKPQIPPKRKGKMAAILENNTQNSVPTGREKESIEQREVYEEQNKSFEDKAIRNVTKDKQNNLNHSNSASISKANIGPTGNQTSSLSRLDGGVVSVVLPERQCENKNQKDFNTICLQVPELGPMETNKANTNPSPYAPKVTKRVIVKNTIKEKNSPTEKSLLPSNVPINCPQAALQYSRGVNAPATALPVPPPTPENSSQDELNDEEFPPPSPEVLLQDSRSRGKATRAAKIVSVKANTETGVKKSTGVKPIANNFKTPRPDATKTVVKKTSDIKPGRRRTEDEHKSIKSSNSRLVASGTKSPSSNISQASLLRNRTRKVQTSVSGPSRTQMQDPNKRIQQAEKHSSIKSIKSFVSTTNTIQKVNGRSLTSNATTESDSKVALKRQRALGGGQRKSKEKTPSRAIDSQAALLSAALNERSGEVESKKTEPANVQSTQQSILKPTNTSSNVETKELDTRPKLSNAQRPPQSTAMSSKMSSKTATKTIDTQNDPVTFSSNIPGDVTMKSVTVSVENVECNETKMANAANSPHNSNMSSKNPTKVIGTQPKLATVVEQAGTTSGHEKPQKSSASVKKETKSTTQKLTTKSKSKAYPTKPQTRNQTRTNQVPKVFDTSPYRPDTRSFRAQPKVEAAKKIIAKTKKKKGSKAASEELLNKSQPSLARSTNLSAPELECTPSQSSLQDITNTGAAAPVDTIPTIATEQITEEAKEKATHKAPEQVSQQPPPTVSTVTHVLQTISETTPFALTGKVKSATNSEKVSDSIVTDVQVTVGFVAKTLQTLNEVAKNAEKTSPPLPPPPVEFRVDSKPKPLPPPPPMIPAEDALPKAGTVAKALQSLSAVTSEANPLIGTAKTFKNFFFKLKNLEETPLVGMKNVEPSGKVTRNGEETNNARPLADILTASVWKANRNKVNETTTNETEIKKETQQSFIISEKLSDKMMENVVQAVAEQAMETNLQQISDKGPTDNQTTQPQTLNELNKSANEETTDLKELENLNITTESISSISGESNTITETITQFIEVSTLTTTEVDVGSPGPLIPSIIGDPIKILVLTNKVSSSSISETHEPEISCSSLAACTDVNNLSESEVAPTTAVTIEPISPSQQLYRKVIDMALVNEAMEMMEPTPLSVQPNIVIKGYTRAEPLTKDYTFAGTGCSLGNDSTASRLRALSKTKGSCSHGPSANVVISTFGYTPMSELDAAASEQLLPSRTSYNITLPPPKATLPLPPLNSTSNTIITTQAQPIQQHHAEPVIQPIRALSPRLRDQRPYPTAHRSRSQRADERNIINRGRVM